MMRLNDRIPAALMEIFRRAYQADPDATEGNLIYLTLRGSHTTQGPLSINFHDLLLELKVEVPAPTFKSTAESVLTSKIEELKAALTEYESKKKARRPKKKKKAARKRKSR